MSNRVLNASSMKEENQKKILRTLTFTECSRAELARRTGLTRSAISVIVELLINQNIIMEGDFISGKIGRKSQALKLNPKRFYMIGVDLGRTECYIGFADFQGEILYNTRLSMETTATEMLFKISEIIEKTIENNKFSGELLGIGITSPGPLDSVEGVILTPPNFTPWFHTKVSDFFQQKFDCPVFLENDANARAVAEKYSGLDNTYKNFIELMFDSGIGSGIVLNDSLFRASSGFGNNFGHTSINYEGAVCQCGNIGCSELYASIPSIVKYAEKLNPLFSDWHAIIDYAKKQNSDALHVIKKEVEYLTVLITNIMNIFDVDCILLSGDIIYEFDLLQGLLNDSIKKKFLSHEKKELKILPTQIENNIQIRSACYLVLDNHLSAKIL